MPPVCRSAWILKTRLDTAFIGAALDAAPCVFNGGHSWAHQAKKKLANTRRTLFELYAGRNVSLLPTALAIDEVTSPAFGDEPFFTTSEDLILALGPLGREYARPERYGNKVDLSFVDPVLAASNRTAALEKAKEEVNRQIILRKEKNDPPTRKSLLVSYLLHVDPILRYDTRLVHPTTENPTLDDALLKVFDKRTSIWLSKVNLDIKDVMNWAWVLTADSSERAALRLTLLAERAANSEIMFRTVPTLLLLFLLRRESIDARALKPILIYVWRLMRISESSMAQFAAKHTPRDLDVPLEGRIVALADNISRMAEHIFMILIIRLMRRATMVWPAACESIVSLLNRYMDGINVWTGVSRSALMLNENGPHLTYAYNTMLRLLSTPSSLHPFQSVIFQQRAQFGILRRMNQFEPPLVVDKRGYKAVVKLQLMHKKTSREREWAHMKAKSWPPWKEDKLGMDAKIGVEHGVSRAKEALNRAKEAGYAADEWDDAAGILSGWDTDGSPTIQSRTSYDFSFNTSTQTRGSRQGDIWASRIRATRTLDEAWSCFLACMDDIGALEDVRGHVYFAMFTKLVYDARRSSGKVKETSADVSIDEQPLPGDGLEVLPAPISPREATYVRRPPPSLDEFLEMMVRNGVQPSGRLLIFLLQNAWSFEAGVKSLEASALQRQHLSALFDDSAVRGSQSQFALESVPDNIFAAFIEFLTRFAPTLSGKHGHNRFKRITTGLAPELGWMGWTKDHYNPKDKPSSRAPLFNPLWRAYRLLIAKRPKYRPAWYHLIRALSNPKAVTGVYTTFNDQDLQDIKTWRITCRLLDRMLDISLHPDLEGFRLLCIGLEKAMFAAERQLRAHRGPITEDDRSDDTVLKRFVLFEGPSLLKVLFKDAVRSTGMQQEIPASIVTEKSEIDALVERAQEERTIKDKIIEDQDQVVSEDDVEYMEDPKPLRSQAFLPPACLLPRLLEAPSPSIIHRFVRILGLSRDYSGILELIEWMSLYADEINTVMDELMNGKWMMKRCMVAIRVFLERSWTTIPHDDGYGHAGYEGVLIEADPAPAEIIRAVRGLVLENRTWGGWATDEEVAEYCLRARFL